MGTKQELTVGDVVTLKSGGPKLTISRLLSDDPFGRRVEADWFGTDNHLHTENFYAISLRKVTNG